MTPAAHGCSRISPTTVCCSSGGPPLAHQPESFRVNPVLRGRSRESSELGDPGHETRVRAHLRAATTLVRNQAELDLAVRHAILAEDPEVLLRVLRVHGHGLLEGGGKELLARALDALPREARSNDPAVLVLESLLCRMTLRYDEAADLSLAAERACEADPSHGTAEGDDLTLDMIALMKLWRSRCGWADPVTAVAAARERMGCRHDVSRGTHRLVPGRSLAWTTWLMGELATVEIRVGDVDEAGVHLRELIHSGHILGHDRMLAVGLAHRGLLEMLDGSFKTAATTADSSLEYADRAGLRSRPHMALAHLVSGWGALHRLDLTGCEGHLVAAEDEVAVEVDLLVSELARLLRARLLAEQGQVDAASRLLAEHRSTEWAIPAFARRLSLIVEAQTAALVNDVATVRDRSLALADLGHDSEAELFAAVADAGDGHVEQALGRIGAVLDQPRLDTATGAVAAAVNVGLMLRLGDTVSAAERMPDLLNRVASQRLLQILTIGFVGGDGFADLLAGQARHSEGHPFAAEALDSLASYVSVPGQGSPRMWAVGTALRSVAEDVAPANGTPGGGVLTRREREVLAELANGGSYYDIAQALFVSENTVKTHLASVYRKLGVDRRGDALRIARTQHLI